MLTLANIPPLQEDENSYDSFELVDLGNRDLQALPIFLYRHAHAIISLNLSRNPIRTCLSTLCRRRRAQRTEDDVHGAQAGPEQHQEEREPYSLGYIMQPHSRPGACWPARDIHARFPQSSEQQADDIT